MEAISQTRIRILTGQWYELKSRSGVNLRGVNLNAVILIDGASLCIFKTDIICEYDCSPARVVFAGLQVGKWIKSEHFDDCVPMSRYI